MLNGVLKFQKVINDKNNIKKEKSIGNKEKLEQTTEKNNNDKLMN